MNHKSYVLLSHERRHPPFDQSLEYLLRLAQPLVRHEVKQSVVQICPAEVQLVRK